AFLPTAPRRPRRPRRGSAGVRRRRCVLNDQATAPRPSLWRHRDFMRLWTAETISQLGTQVTLLALPLTAIVTLHATAWQVGVLTAVEFAPFVIVGLPAGVWVDRLRRKPVLVAGDLG